MTIKLIKARDIDTSVIYKTVKEVAAETGLTIGTVRYHLKSTDFNGFQIDREEKERTSRGTKRKGKLGAGKYCFIHPDEAKRFKAMVDSGLIQASINKGEI